jgi:hypothetical protein
VSIKARRSRRGIISNQCCHGIGDNPRVLKMPGLLCGPVSVYLDEAEEAQVANHFECAERILNLVGVVTRQAIAYITVVLDFVEICSPDFVVRAVNLTKLGQCPPISQ